MVCGHQGVLDVLSTDKMFSFRDDHFRISKKVKIKTRKKNLKSKKMKSFCRPIFLPLLLLSNIDFYKYMKTECTI